LNDESGDPAMNRFGEIKVSFILKQDVLKNLNCTLEDVMKIVEKNAKKRFELKVDKNTGELMIRAYQRSQQEVECAATR
jgi:RNA:NAD 2'-phosphotransferase (TPT1/KptA family)